MAAPDNGEPGRNGVRHYAAACREDRMSEEGAMTPRQRMATAMAGGIPDCVPFLPQICVPHAVRALGLDFESTLLDVIRNPLRMNAITFECVKMYGVAGLRAWVPPDPLDVVKVDGTWYGRDPDTGKRLGRVDFKGGGEVLPSDEPVINSREDIDAIRVVPAEELVRSGKLDGVRAIIEEAGDDYFVVSTPPGFAVEYLTSTRGKQQALMDLIDRPDFCHRAMEKATDVAIQWAHALVEIGIHALLIADVFGGVMSPAHFGEFCVPYFKRFVRTLKGRGPLIYMHICGNSTGIFELMADTGVHCIEPLDPLGGVKVSDAKRRVGRRVALMGGLDTRLLAHGTLEQVRADAVRCLGEGMPGGGYILACGDMLPTETSAEKVRMLLEMCRTLGRYRD